MMRSDFGSTLLSAAGLLSAALAASAITPLALASDDDPTESFATLQIKNNFASKTDYFGVNLTDDQIWVYLAQGSQVTYNGSTRLAQGQWLNFSEIQNGELTLGRGSATSRLYVAISNTAPSQQTAQDFQFAPIKNCKYTPGTPPGCAPPPPPEPVIPCVLCEWTFTGTGSGTFDISYVDQFAIAARVTVGDTTSGCTGDKDTKEILEALQSSYEQAAAHEAIPPNVMPPNPPDGTMPFYPLFSNYTGESPPLPSGDAYQTGCCLGNVAGGMNRFSQRVNVLTGIAAIDNLQPPPFYWQGSSKGRDSQISGVHNNIVQLFGRSYENYLAHLMSLQGSDGFYYIDYSDTATNGHSFHLKVIKDVDITTTDLNCSGDYGHGLEISNIKVCTGTDCMTGSPSFESGTLLGYRGKEEPPDLEPIPATITILPNGTPCLMRPSRPPNYFGLWTDQVIVSGTKPYTDTDPTWGKGPVINFSGACREPAGCTDSEIVLMGAGCDSFPKQIYQLESTEIQSLIQSILYTVSNVFTTGMLDAGGIPVTTPGQTPPTKGTCYLFASLTSAEGQDPYTNSLFKNSEYCDPYVETLIKYQSLSAQGGAAYLSPYLDRFVAFKPVVTVNEGDTMVFELGVPKTCSADFDSDGDVDGADLGVMLAHWGEVPDGQTLPHDLNSDGRIDGGDLTIFLGQWGTSTESCP